MPTPRSCRGRLETPLAEPLAESHASGIPALYIPTMHEKPFPLKGVPKREIFLRVWAYGIPIGIGFLGLFLGWWESLANTP
jgi:hypothetical protein